MDSLERGAKVIPRPPCDRASLSYGHPAASNNHRLTGPNCV